jgi:hypothetical protein
MNKRRNWMLWAGFLLVLAGLFTYVPLFALFPITRDFPWVNLLFICAGALCMAVELGRAFLHPEVYRGKILGSTLAALSLAGIGLFAYGLFYLGRQIPASPGAPKVGQKAPDFTLPDQNAKLVSLADLLSSPLPGTTKVEARAVLLIFYRGYW